MPLTRITSFKVPNESDIPAVLDSYKVLASEAQKDNKPYLLSTTAHATTPDARNGGYAVVGITKYASADDMKYYDEECAAHRRMKAGNAGRVEVPPLVMVMETE